jgi:3'(2'), 5'-bisphosphate nucleotidase
LVIREAGGTVTDLDGRSLDFRHGPRLVQNRGVLATNGPIHQTLLDAIRQVETGADA